MENYLFSIDRFESLQSVDLHDYMEPLLVEDNLFVSDDEIEILRAKLDRYDHFHLVYTIILIARFAPSKIVHLLPKYLTHREPSVQAAALNVISDLDSSFIDEDFVREVESYASHSNWTYLKSLVKNLEAKLN